LMTSIKGRWLLPALFRLSSGPGTVGI
jgi:hypothetical protein